MPLSVTVDDLLVTSSGRMERGRGETVVMEVTNNATIRNGGTITASIDISAANFTIGGGAYLNADGRGHGSSSGTGEGTDQQYFAAGAGHAGRGGTATQYYPAGGGVYGSITEPAAYGSGGGYASYRNVYGGTGGGVVRLVVSDVLTIDGQLRANGYGGGNDGNYYAGGGGAGGSIWVTTGSLEGGGLIFADGGAGGAGNGGGGGGGRIAVYYDDNSGFSGTVHADGGSGYQWGGAGTVFTKSSAQTLGDLAIDNDTHSGAWTPFESVPLNKLTVSGNAIAQMPMSVTVDDLLVTSSGRLECGRGQTVVMEVSRDALLSNGGRITSSLDLNVRGNLVIDPTSFISGDGRGYGSSSGPGQGGDQQYFAGGAGYGGKGGIGFQYSAPGGVTYGSETEPIDCGSGGGYASYRNVSGGTGGGRMQITVAGGLTVDGSLTVDGYVGGNNGSYYAGGGGSGGSMYVLVGTLDGDGVISADGGDGGAGNGGGGGGGRVAIYFGDMDDYTGTVRANGGTGYQAGSKGTIYYGQLEPLRVEGMSPSGITNQAVDHVDVTFSEEINPATLTAGDVVVTDPDGAVIPLTGDPQHVAGDVWRLSFASQSAEGQYDVRLGPDVENLDADLMNQDLDPIAGEDPSDAFYGSFVIDTTPPRIIDYSPSGEVNDPVSSMDVTFSEELQAGSMNLSKVTINGPVGEITPTDLVDLGGNSYRITFPAQITDGAYHVLIGPDVRDLAGNAMDQDDDGIAGEPGEDVFDGTFTMHIADLTIDSVTPATAPARFGETVDIDWIGRNAGAAVLVGSWTDRLWLSVNGTYGDGDDVLLVDLPVSETLAVGQTYAAGATVTLPNNLSWSDGTFTLFVVADVNNDVTEDDETNNITSGAVELYREQGPRVSDMQPETTAGIINYVEVEFDKAINAATLTAADVSVEGPDALALGITGISHISGNVYRISFAKPHAAGLHGVEVGPGVYDLLGTPMDQDADADPGEDPDDVFSGSFAVDLPDLVIDDIDAPLSAQFGQTVPVSWIGRNAGVVTAEDAWYDRLYLSPDDIFDNGNDVALSTVGIPGGLVAGDTYNPSVSAALPIDASIPIGTHTYYLFVKGDCAGQLSETDDGNNTRSTAISLTQPSGPAIATMQPSDDEGVIRYVDATFDGPIAGGSFTPADATLGGPAGGVAVTSIQHIGGNSYRVHFAAPPAAGLYAITIGPAVTDPLGHWMNQDGDDFNAETPDDIFEAQFAIQLPDLAAGTAGSLDGSAFFGDSVSIQWTVRNDGTVSVTGAWTDRLWLSDDMVLDAGDLSLGSFSGTSYGPLAPDGQYTRTESVTIPVVDGMPEGPYFVIVQTDAGAQHYETDEFNNSSSSGAIQLSAQSGPGIIQSVAGPAGDVVSHLDVTFDKDINTATFTAADVTVTDPGSAVVAVTGVSRVAGRTFRITFQRPVVAGTYSMTVGPQIRDTQGYPMNQDADAINGEIGADEFTTTIDVELPNLVGSSVIPSVASASWGESFDLSWTIDNVSTVRASGVWYDRVWLSDAPTLAGATTLVELASTSASAYSPLAGGGQYSRTISVTMPSVVQGLGDGDYYLIVEADGTGVLAESSNADNALASGPIALSAEPGPQIIAMTPRGDGYVVNYVDVEFDSEIDESTFTIDDVTVKDPTAQSVSITQVRALGARTFRISFARPVVAGTYDVEIGPGIADLMGNLMNSDGDGSNGEPVEDVYTGSFEVVLPDLEIASVAPAKTVVLWGETFDLDWMVRNNSLQVGASGFWRDSFYLSTDQTFDLLTDVSLGSLGAGANSPLPAAAQYPGNRSVTMPAPGTLTDGTYYLIVVTDATGVVGENDESNNVRSSVQIIVGSIAGPIVTGILARNDGQVVDYVDVTFDHDMDPASFTTDQATVHAPGGGVLSVLGVQQQASDTFRVVFETPADAGQYELVVGPSITDEFGYAMNTDGDGVNGEDPDDLFNGFFDVVLPDLVVDSVTPAVGAANFGQQVEVTYEVRDAGAVGTVNSWSDKVYLSAATTLDGSETLLGTFSAAAYAPLGAGGTYSATVGVTIPVAGDLADGTYYLIVETDANGDEPEGDETNNATAFGQVTLTRLSGPQVIDWALSGEAGIADYVDIEFDKEIGSGTFTLTDVSLTGPGGAVTVTQIEEPGTGATEFRIHFETPAQAGSHTLTVGPDVRDLLGNRMNQNAAMPNGEDPGDVFEQTFSIELPDLTVVSVTPDMTTANFGETFDVTWVVENLSGAAAEADWVDKVWLSNDDTLDPGDLVLGSQLASVSAQNLPLVAGDTYSATISVTLPNDPQVYSDGPYWLFVETDATADPPESNEDNNDLSAELALSILPGPQITAMQPSTEGHVVDHVDVTFDRQIDSATFTAADVLLVGPGGAVAVNSVSDSGGNTYRVAFDQPTVGGLHTISIGPDVSDPLGNPMNQNAALPNGEDPADKFVDTFIVVLPDLVVDSVTPIETDLHFGEDIELGWMGRNAGGIGASGQWSDHVWLSSDTVLDGGDHLLGDLAVAFDPLDAGADYNASAAMTLPNDPTQFNAGVYYLIVQANGDNGIGESDTTNNAFASGAVNLSYLPGPRVVGVEPADVGRVINFVDVEFDSAIDQASLTGADATVTGPTGAVAITGVSHVTGNTYRFTFLEPVGEGSYDIEVGPNVTDTLGNWMDQDDDGINGEPADAFVGAFTVTLPDLSSDSVVPDTSTPWWGQSFDIAYSISNIGTSDATGTWTDRLWLSADGVLDGPDRLLASTLATRYNPLAAGDSYSPTVTVTLPTESAGLADGAYYIILEADAADALAEANEANNVLVSTQLAVATLSGPIVLSMTPSAGGGVTDNVEVVFDRDINSSTFSLGDVTLDGPGGPVSVTVIKPLASNNFQIQFETPVTGGVHTLRVGPDIRDMLGNRMDQNAALPNGQPADAFEGTFTVSMPDLAPANVTPQRTSLWWGETFSVNWDIDNVGGATAEGDWVDRVWMSTDTVLDAGDTPVLSVPSTLYEPVPASEQRTVAGYVTLPIDPANYADETYYLIVEINATGELAEGSTVNNLAVSGPIDISRMPGPHVTGMVPSGDVELGVDAVNVSFDVSIDPTSFTAGDVAVNGPAGAVAVDSVAHIQGTTTWQVSFATLETPGAYTVEIGPHITDLIGNEMDQDEDSANGEIGEDVFTGNLNVRLPDLAVDLVRADQPGAIFGDTLDLTWVVRNADQTASADQPWIDRVWLSSDTVLDGGDVRLVSRTNTQSLGATQQYTVSMTVELPLNHDLPAGTYHLIAATDNAGDVLESNEANNTLVSAGFAVDLPVLPDLVPSDLQAAMTSYDDDGNETSFDPQSLLPGESVTVSWTVTNAGTAALTGSWTDTVSMSDDNAVGGDVLLGSFSHSGTLGIGEAMTRTQTIQIPETGFSGAGWLIVTVDADDEHFEIDDTNNHLVSDTSRTVPMSISMEADVDEVFEDGDTARVTLIRRGDVSEVLAVYLRTMDTDGTPADGSELAVPEVVIFGPGQMTESFEAAGLTDGVVDGFQSVTIQGHFDAADGDPFDVDPDGLLTGAPGSTNVIAISVHDIDTPSLALTAPVDQIIEGGTTTATITVDPAQLFDTKIELFLSVFGQLELPGSLTLPAGETSINFEIEAIGDDYMEGFQTVRIMAKTMAHGSDILELDVIDDDQWPVSVVLDSEAVSEASAYTRVRGTVFRTGPTDRERWLELTSDNESAAKIQSAVLVPEGFDSARFTIYVVDDFVPDGTQTATITATPVDGYTGERMTAAAGSADMDVLDDDAPYLSIQLDKAIVHEGAVGVATTGRVYRHTSDTSAAVTVDLASLDTGEATVPLSVIIPAGADHAEFDVFAVPDGASDGTQPVTITATAAGYSTGSNWLYVTDEDMPDLIAENVVSPSAGFTDQEIEVSYRIANRGPSDAAGSWVERIYAVCSSYLTEDFSLPPAVSQGSSEDCGCPGAAEAAAAERVNMAVNSSSVVGAAGSDTFLLRELTFDGLLPADTSYDRTVTTTLPHGIGDYYILVVVDQPNNLPELDDDNNYALAPDAMDVAAEYNATVHAAQREATSGDTVTLFGTATRAADGQPAVYEDVTVRVMHAGTRRAYGAVTDEFGQYAVIFHSLPGEAGHYEVAAGHPGDPKDVVQDTFTLLGWTPNAWSRGHSILDGESASGSFTIRNLSVIPLTNITASLEAVPDNLDVQVNLSSTTLDGTSTIRVDYSITVLNLDNTWANFGIHLTNDEGLSMELGLNTTMYPEPTVAPEVYYPVLTGSGTLKTGMVRSRQRSVQYKITNTGNFETGDLEVRTPSGLTWFRVANANGLPNLQPGESTELTIVLTPPADLPLGPYNGTFAVDPANGNSLVASFQINNVSTAVGGLEVQIEDEGTYYGDGTGVEDAVVTLRDVFTGQVVATQTTGPDGIATFNDVTEATYYLQVNARQHESYQADITIAPGETIEEYVFLRGQYVEYNWIVEEIEIEDRYEITLETVYEANVPAPVVVVEPGAVSLQEVTDNFTKDVVVINFTISNHGLIAAEDGAISFPEHPNWNITPLVENLGTLPAQSSIVVPVKFERIYLPPEDNSDSASTAAENAGSWDRWEGDCHIIGHYEYRVVCGVFGYAHKRKVAVVDARIGPGCNPTGGSLGHNSLGGAYYYRRRTTSSRRPYNTGGSSGGGEATPQPTPPRPNRPRPPVNWGAASWEPSYKRCLCDPNNFEEKCLEASLSLNAGWLTGMAETAFNAVTPPFISLQDTEASLSFGGSLCTCCDEETKMTGLRGEVSVSGSLGGTVMVGWSGSLDWTTTIGGQEAGVHLDASAGIPITANISISATRGTECFWSGDRVTASISGSITASPGIQGSGTLSIPGGATYSISANGTLTASVSGSLNYNSESGWSGQICGGPVVISAGFSYGAELSGQAVPGTGSEATYTRTLMGRKCYPSGASTADGGIIIAAEDLGLLPPPESFLAPINDAESWLTMAGYTSAAELLTDISGDSAIGVILAEDVESHADLVDAMAAAERFDVAAAEGRVTRKNRAVSADEKAAELRAEAADEEEGVCAHAKIQLDQEAVLTRKVFAGTLDITNYSEQNTVDDLAVTIDIRDADGKLANDKFVILAPELDNIQVTETGDPPAGYDPFDDGMWLGNEKWRLGTDTTGRARWIIIPTEEAALEGPADYAIGGYMTYSVNGRETTSLLMEHPVTVHPQPKLDLDYFWQRDVYSDDPHTEEVEPAQPFTLAVMVHNEGGGTASGFRITSAEPKIVETDKGLLVDFDIIGTEVNNQQMTPSLTANFGDIAPGDTAVARWLMTSSLQGHFIDYKASFRHADALGGEATSLLDEVSIHELIHVVEAAGIFDDGLYDFLVNDHEDPTYEPVPDTLYLSDGSVMPVSVGAFVGADGAVSPGDLDVIIEADMFDEWSYLKLADPGAGLYQLLQVVRLDESDNPAGEVAVGTNAWQTDRSYKESEKQPVYEDVLHLLDYDSTGRYKLVYAPIDDQRPQLLAVEQPDSPTLHSIDSLEVSFSEQIDLMTFDQNDLVLTRDGGSNLITSGVTIGHIESGRYLISGFGPLTTDDGTYELTVDAAGLTDLYQNSGVGSETAEWFKAEFAPTILAIIGAPTGITNQAPGTVYVKFSEPVDKATFDWDNIELTLDGGANLVVADSLTVSAVTPDTFRVNGLDALAASGCTYVLTANAAGVVDLDQGSGGIGAAVVEWYMDTDGPVITRITDEPTGTIAATVDELEVVFNEAINGGTFDTADLSLVRDNGDNLIDGSVSVDKVSDTTYRISGLGALTAANGDYELRIDVRGIEDEVGNGGLSVRTVAWTMDTANPDPAFNVTIAPDTGEIGDSVTSQTSLILGGELAENGLQVAVYDETSGTDLGSAQVVGTDFTIPLDLATGGRHVMRLTVSDNAGNAARSTFRFTVDQSPPAVDTIEGLPFVTLDPVDSLTVVFTENIVDGAFDLSAISLTRGGGDELAAPPVTLTKIDPATYRIDNLTGVTADPGDYELSIDLTGVTDLAGNNGVGQSVRTWTLSADQTPPSVTASEIQHGQAQRHAIDSFSVTFDEDTNIQTLIDNNELVTGPGAALVLTNLGVDADADADRQVPLSEADFTWDSGALTLSWDGSASPLADGYYELRLTGAVTDAVGNPLDGDGAGGNFRLNFHRLAYDLTGDAIVDTSDLDVVDAAFGSRPESPNWNAFVDFDPNDRITSRDRRPVIQAMGSEIIPPDTEAPTVTGASAAAGGDQRSYVDTFSVTFSEPMNLAELIADGSIVNAVSLVNLGVDADNDGDQQVPLSAGQFAYNDATYTLTWSLDSFAGGTETLADGYYELTLDETMVADLAGNPLTGGFGAVAGSATGQTVVEFDAAELLQAGGADIQVNEYSVPSMVDWNNDSLADLLLGEKTADSLGKVRVYLNSGTASEPAFEAYSYVQTDQGDLTVSASGCLGVFPVAVDWDADGRKDMLVGLADGTVRVFLNGNTDAAPVFGSSSVVQVGQPGAKADIDVGARAAVSVVDWNNDGRIDMVLGSLDGGVLVYLNESDAGAPDFRTELVIQDGAGNLIVPGGRSSVAAADLDGDGRKDLLAGNTSGELYLYLNVGSDTEPEFDAPRHVLADGVPIDLDATRSRPTVCDFDSDGNLDVLLGASDGLVRLYRNPVVAVDAGDPAAADTNDLAYYFHRLEGDANGDRLVSTIDENPIIAAMGAQPGDAHWDVNADLDRDGEITASDRQIVLDAMGSQIIPPAIPTGSSAGGGSGSSGASGGGSHDAEVDGDVGNSAAEAYGVGLFLSGTTVQTWTGTFTASLANTDDTDWYTLVAPADGTLRISATDSNSAALLPLTLYEQTTDAALSIEDSGIGEVSTTVVSGRVYFVQVDGPSGWTGDAAIDYLAGVSLSQFDDYFSLVGGALVHADTPWRGGGYSVAVLDTGIDYTHPDLAGRVILGPDFAEGDDDPMDTVGHGTHVAGIIASSDPHAPGLAPEANVIALKVSPDNSMTADVDDIAAALQWVLDHRAEYNIAAVNLSFAIGNVSKGAGLSQINSLYQQLSDQGVFIAAAAGNSYATFDAQGLSELSAGNAVVAVGAVWDSDAGGYLWNSGAQDYTSAADRLVSFSQRSGGLDLVAPGADILGLMPGGGLIVRSGTSMATPLVTASAVLLRQASEAEGVAIGPAEIAGYLQSGAVSVYDGDDEDDNVTNTGRTYERLDINGALEQLTEPAAASIVAAIPGDANLDGRVDSDDIAVFFNNFGRSRDTTWAMGDFDGNGRVDLSDFGILRSNLGTVAAPPADETPNTDPPAESGSSAQVASADLGGDSAPATLAVAASPQGVRTAQPVDESNGPTDTTTLLGGVDLLAEMPSSYIPRSEASAMASPATALHRAATTENDPRSPGDDLLTATTIDLVDKGLYVSALTDDLLPDLLAESSATALLDNS